MELLKSVLRLTHKKSVLPGLWIAELKVNGKAREDPGVPVRLIPASRIVVLSGVGVLPIPETCYLNPLSEATSKGEARPTSDILPFRHLL